MESIPNVPESLFCLLLLNTCMVSFYSFFPRPQGSENKKHVILVIISVRENCFPLETSGYKVPSEAPLLFCFSAEVLVFASVAAVSYKKEKKRERETNEQIS